MGRLIVVNQLTEETAEGENAIPPEYARYLGAISHRQLWCAAADDVLVLPTAPDPEFVAYVTAERGGPAPAIVVPPPGRQGEALLYDDRLAAPGFVAELRSLVEHRSITELRPFYFDRAVVRLARELGLDRAIPGFDFLAEGGNELVNSKSFFRIVAAGTGAAVPPGRIAENPDEAAEFAAPLLERGIPVILKQDLHGGGYGNEILAPSESVGNLGAIRRHLVADRAAAVELLAESWPRYSAAGRRPLVVERYVDGSLPIYVEFLIGTAGVDLVGYGEMRMKPTNNGLVIPPPTAGKPEFAQFLESAHRLAEAAHGVGYRGSMSIDAIATPGGEILFNEFNGRVGGSTHVHRIAETLVGDDYLTERVIAVRNRCGWTSLAETARLLAEHGLAYDAKRRHGAIISGDDTAGERPSGQLVLVADTAESVLALENRVVAVLELEGPSA